MVGEGVVKKAAARKGYQGSLFELYAWFFMRVSGTVLLFIVTFHLFYMHFIIPGGVAEITHQTVVERWTDPQTGSAWRLFDLLLLLFALTHGASGMRYIVEDYIHSDAWRALVKTLLYLVYFVLLMMGAYIIFSFTTVAA